MSKILKHPSVSAQEYCLPISLEAMPAIAEWTGTEAETPAELVQADAQQALEAEAYAQGQQAGACELQQVLVQEREQGQTQLVALAAALDDFYQRLELRMSEAAMAMVRKIVGAASEQHTELIRESLRKVLARHNQPGELLTLHLHPDDYQRLVPDPAVAPKNLRMLPDPEIQRGGCLLETKFGMIDARLDTQLQELEKTLREQMSAGVSPTQRIEGIQQTSEVRAEGRIVKIVGTVIESRGPSVTVGERCEIIDQNGEAHTWAEVIGFRENQVLLMPLGDARGIGPGSRVIAKGKYFTAQVGEHLLGRVINGLGQPIDGLGALCGGEAVSIFAPPNNPMQRQSIQAPLYTGIRAIDGLLTCAKGGRMGIFAGSGVGKSVLLGMMARNTQADVNVIALIGERGREVKEFVEHDLGPEGLKRSVVIAVTSDESPVLRIHGAQLAASVAEYFARQGKHVMFMMDSVTRFAMAHREIGLAIGEPPTTKGYTPSTFAALPKLLERSGLFGERGSITGFYTVLVEGDDMDEPVSDHVRSILDGHIVLSRALFSQNHFPAIDILNSISRLSKQVCSPEQREQANNIRDLLATYFEAQDLVNIGAYVQGSNPKIDTALKVIQPIKDYLRQGLTEKILPEAVWGGVNDIIQRLAT